MDFRRTGKNQPPSVVTDFMGDTREEVEDVGPTFSSWKSGQSWPIKAKAGHFFSDFCALKDHFSTKRENYFWLSLMQMCLAFQRDT